MKNNEKQLARIKKIPFFHARILFFLVGGLSIFTIITTTTTSMLVLMFVLMYSGGCKTTMLKEMDFQIRAHCVLRVEVQGQGTCNWFL